MAHIPETDVCQVLVVGGGFAAIMAAISAAQSGAKVVMLVKGRIGESGSSAKSGGLVAASMARAQVDDPRQYAKDIEGHIADTLAMGCGLCSTSHVRALAEDAPDGILQLERLGVKFSKTKDAQFIRLLLPGHTYPRGCQVIGGGAALIATLRAWLQTLQVQVIEGAAAVHLIKEGNQVCGALACEVDGDRQRIIHAGGTVIATGGATGLFRTLSGDVGNTGDGLILGYDAGAELGNLEFTEFTLIFRVGGKILPIAGLAPFLSRGCTLVNRSGDRFMEQRYTASELSRTGRAEILRAVVHEVEEGRGPIAIECSALTPSAWDEFERSQGAPVLDRLRGSGCNYRSDRIEVVPAAHSTLAGIITDSEGATCVRGLWAAGECAAGVHGAGRLSGNGLAACLVFGGRCGRNAASFAAEHTMPRCAKDFDGSGRFDPPHGDDRILEDIRRELGDIAERALGVVRDSASLRQAEAGFRELQQRLETVRVVSQVRLSEVLHLAKLGELIAASSHRRGESRGLHFRTDVTESRSSGLNWLTVQKDPMSRLDAWHCRTVC